MQNDKNITKKNRPLPISERPDWAKSIPAKEWKKHVHSPQCKVCNANHEGRNLRSEIEALVIERKTAVEVCNVIFERYGLQLAPHNISRHMARHAPSYVNVLDGLLQSELGDVLNGTVGPIVDQIRYLLGVLQVAWQQLLLHPEQVSVADGIRAAEKLASITKDIDIRHHDNTITREDINQLLDILQTVLTEEQREEVSRRFYVNIDAEQEPESSPPIQGQVPVGVNDENGVVVDGEYISLDDIPTLSAEDLVGDYKE